MRLYWLVPEGLKDYVKLLRARRRFPRCNIGTPDIAPDVELGEGCSLATLVQLGDGVSLGDWTFINRGTIVSSGKMGRFCSVGPYCQIGMADHPMEFLSTAAKLYGPSNVFGDGSHWEHYGQPPQIGSDVYIGAGVLMRQGVKVGHGAVIGAGAVVLKDVPPYAMVAGVPARLLRYRFSPDTVRRLIESAWWERPVAELKAFREAFFNPVETAPELLARSAGRDRSHA